jgi:hypothetical protein
VVLVKKKGKKACMKQAKLAQNNFNTTLKANIKCPK